MKTALTLLFLLMLYSMKAAVPAVAAEELRFRSVDTARFPSVVLELSGGGPEMAGYILNSADVTVTENGRRIARPSVETLGDRPIIVVLAVDTSGSMNGQPLADAKKAAKSFIDGLKSPNRAAIVRFSSTPALVVPPTSNKDDLIRGIDGMIAADDTALYDGVNLGLDVCAQTDVSGRYVIVLSDGADNRSGQGLAAVIERAVSLRVTVFGVGLVSADYSVEALTQMASRTGGSVVSTADSSSLSSVYISLAREIRQQYRITYESAARRDERALSVAVGVDRGTAELTASQVVSNPSFDPVQDGSPADLTRDKPRLIETTGWYLTMIAILFMALFTGTQTLLPVIAPSRSALKRQVRFHEEKAARRTSAGKTAPELPSERRMLAEAVRMTGLVAEKRGFLTTVQQLLIRADMPWKPAEFIMVHFAVAFLTGAAGFAITRSTGFSLAFIILGTALPLVYIQRRISRRTRAFHDQLPNMLNMISGSMKAGYGLLQALRLAGSEMPPPASQEIDKVISEVQLGLSLEDALDGMADRNKSEQLSWTVTSIKIHREVGGNLAELLDKLSQGIRERDRISRQIQVLTSEGRLSAVILFVLPFALGLVFYLLNRPYVSLLVTTAPGRVMVLMAALMMVAGVFWFRRIVSIET